MLFLCASLSMRLQVATTVLTIPKLSPAIHLQSDISLAATNFCCISACLRCSPSSLWFARDSCWFAHASSFRLVSAIPCSLSRSSLRARARDAQLSSVVFRLAAPSRAKKRRSAAWVAALCLASSASREACVRQALNNDVCRALLSSSMCVNMRSLAIWRPLAFLLASSPWSSSSAALCRFASSAINALSLSSPASSCASCRRAAAASWVSCHQLRKQSRHVPRLLPSTNFKNDASAALMDLSLWALSALCLPQALKAASSSPFSCPWCQRRTINATASRALACLCSPSPASLRASSLAAARSPSSNALSFLDSSPTAFDLRSSCLQERTTSTAVPLRFPLRSFCTASSTALTRAAWLRDFCEASRRPVKVICKRWRFTAGNAHFVMATVMAWMWRSAPICFCSSCFCCRRSCCRSASAASSVACRRPSWIRASASACRPLSRWAASATCCSSFFFQLISLSWAASSCCT
mmetsp:Transcript_83125/g.235786  ORF Transcript_83125/g.235786 Transcript_83125/m.235786 type:complete len:470 (+) Transcript_83125:1323-2732(+)